MNSKGRQRTLIHTDGLSTCHRTWSISNDDTGFVVAHQRHTTNYDQQETVRLSAACTWVCEIRSVLRSNFGAGLMIQPLLLLLRRGWRCLLLVRFDMIGTLRRAV